MFLQVVWKATPLNTQQEHPVNRFLQCFVSTIILIELAHTLLTVAQVKYLFLVDFHKGTLPGTKSGALVDITEQDIGHTVIVGASDNDTPPTINANIKAIWVRKSER